jgi:hypothetical protein
MLLSQLFQYAFIFVVAVHAQVTLTGTFSASTGLTEATLPTGSYITYSSTIIVSSSNKIGILGSMTNSVSSMAVGNMSSSTTTITSESRTVLLGTNAATTSAINGTATASGNFSASSTSSSAQPTNTTPCNGYPELCNRKYSNITSVCAHNSPFTVPGNVASNQELPVTAQLNDGIR